MPKSLKKLSLKTRIKEITAANAAEKAEGFRKYLFKICL
jgi:hypothetical protein